MRCDSVTLVRTVTVSSCTESKFDTTPSEILSRFPFICIGIGIVGNDGKNITDVGRQV